jgi:ribonucrease Y
MARGRPVDAITIAIGFGGLALGAGAAYLKSAGHSKRLVDELEAAQLEAGASSRSAEEALSAAREVAEADAREQVLHARAELKREQEVANTRAQKDERRLGERAAELDRRASRSERREEDLGRREAGLAQKEQGVGALREEVDALREQALERLERVAELSRDDAREQLLERMEETNKRVVARRLKEMEESAREQSEQTAKSIISMAIQRYAGEYCCERTVSLVSLPNEELKGRIIGREGRNIRALEAATGVDFIIDDTPETIVISAFNPIRREVARRTLEALLEDGRIHPSRIEAVVRRTESEFHKIIRNAGLEAADEAGVSGIHPEILKLIGALKYRTSYGQNQWQHALEVAFICGMMASELGLDVRRAKRAGLLHDIGKVMDQTAEGSHALIGAEFARKHGESKIVVNAIASHHEEVPQETIYACLTQAADAISGARPGARRQMMKSYNQRLTDLERISNSFPGVDRSYAVQAGREVRIIVENNRVTDEDAVLLSHQIAQKIESDMAYPGQIKVTVIRETRVVNYAR